MPMKHAAIVRFPGGAKPLILLTAATGAMDALVFTCHGQVFASVLTGNFVLLGASVVLPWREFSGPVTVIAGYLLGVLLAARRCRAEDTRRIRRIAQCLLAEAALVVVLAVLAGVLGDHVTRTLVLTLASLAMGVQSATVMAADSNSPTTYLTSTFTRFFSDAAVSGTVDPWAAARIAALVAGAGAGVAVGLSLPNWGFALPALLIVAASVFVVRTTAGPVSEGD
ncbi:YoaK family protein [Nocardia huaxiensis]|uniref:YoaK family protein n=1 Tax=Nocardia huaxiensis TaxID=2755382 RepID=UPI001E56D8C9|nr:YoaK family protein [Nocardia huaxiensis]UFS97533.1 DUF1275 domain-containing protein [Nocardia huaxiensis]